MHPISRRTFVACLLFGLAASAAPALHADTRLVYSRAVRASAWVITPDSSGTGVLVDRAKRLMLTNAHVVKTHKNVNLVFPVFEAGRVAGARDYYWKNWKRLAIKGRVLKVDVSKDLALIQLDALPSNAAAVSMASSEPAVGDALYLVNSPAADWQAWKLNPGTIKRAHNHSLRYREGTLVSAYMFFSDMPAINGFSGGGVFNERGQLVAIHCAREDGTGFACAVGLRHVRVFLGG